MEMHLLPTILVLWFFKSAYGGIEDMIDRVPVLDTRSLDPTSACSKQYKWLSEKKDLWKRMADASNRIVPSGVLYGNYFDIGNYEECTSIEEYIPAEGETIYGKYCLGTIPRDVTKSVKLSSPSNNSLHDNKLRILGGDKYTMGIQLAFCVPSGCKASDLTIQINPKLKLLFWDKYCRSKEDVKKLDAGAIVAIFLLSLVGCLAIVQTIYDVYLHYTGQKPSITRLLISGIPEISFLSLLNMAFIAAEPLNGICLAFSVLTNGRKLLSITRNPDQLLCLNGLKAISMMWVILGHTFTAGGFIKNFNDLWNWKSRTSSYFLLGATLSVDTFFAIGGLVLVYTFLKSMDKGVSFKLHQYYIHRYLRLTPALAAVVLFYATLIEYVGDGPFWTTIELELRDVCRKMWWSTLLYVQNYVSDDGQFCIGQSWYLSVDMQLFVLSPLILIPLHKWPRNTLCGLWALICAGIVSPFVVAWEKKVMASMIIQDSMTEYYTATHARFGPYVIGMLTGYYIYKIKKTKYQLRIPHIYVTVAWILLLCGLGACVFTQEKMLKDTDRLSNSLHVAFNRNMWASGVCLVVVLCTLGKGGPIDGFLSASVFQLITKLSYSMYITHLGLIRIWVSSGTTEVRFSNLQRIFDFWGFFALTIFISVPLCLLFESPIIVIEKMIFSAPVKKRIIGQPQV